MRLKRSISMAFLLSAVVLFISQVPLINDRIGGNSISQDASRDIAGTASLSNRSRYDNSIGHKLEVDSRLKNISDSLPENSCLLASSIKTNKISRDVTFSINANEGYIPASTNKLLTAAVVLSRVAPDTTLDTALYSEKKSGKLITAYLQTSGDPSFVTTIVPPARRKANLSPKTVRTLDEFVNSIKKSGVTSINKLQIDNTWFKLPNIEKGWEKDKSQVGAIAAFNIDEGFNLGVLSTDPNNNAALALKDALSREGISIGSITFGPLPSKYNSDKYLVAKTSSPKMIDLISEMLKTSDNVFAEQILAAAVHIDRGEVTLKSREDFVSDSLAQLIGDMKNIKFINGSGYSRDTVISCATQQKILLAMNSKNIDLVQLSSNAGRDGTLLERFSFSQKMIFAKTGTLNGVTALTGEIAGETENELVFSFISNGSFSQDQGYSYQDNVIKMLTEMLDNEELNLSE